MVKALLVALLLSVSAHAETLDSVVEKANIALNPTTLNQNGFEVEWREEMGYVWLNITRVTYLCKKEDRVYIVDGQLQKLNVDRCRGYVTAIGNSLYQIACESARGANCKKLLAKTVTPEIIRSITNRGIRDAYVK